MQDRTTHSQVRLPVVRRPCPDRRARTGQHSGLEQCSRRGRIWPAGGTGGRHLDESLQLPGFILARRPFPTPNVGYAVGGPDWSTTGPSRVAKTTDGGQTWVTTFPAGFHGWLKGLDCKDANTCFASGQFAKFLRTTDGGTTWIDGDMQTFNGVPYRGYIHSMVWTGKDNVVLGGGTYYNPDAPGSANFLRTPDGLAAPNFKVFGVAAVNRYYSPVMSDISCPAPGVCYAAPITAQVIKTTDNGRHLGSNVPTSWWTPNEWYGISCADTNTCWAAGKNKGRNSSGVMKVWGIIEVTRDGGATWTEQAAGSAYGAQDIPGTRFWDIKMADATHGYAVGCQGAFPDFPDGDQPEHCTGSGVVYRTDDGVHWTLMQAFPSAVTTSDLTGIEVRGLDDIFVTTFGGDIWHYSLCRRGHLHADADNRRRRRLRRRRPLHRHRRLRSTATPTTPTATSTATPSTPTATSTATPRNANGTSTATPRRRRPHRPRHRRQRRRRHRPDPTKTPTATRPRHRRATATADTDGDADGHIDRTPT